MFKVTQYRSVYTGSVKNLRVKKKATDKAPGVYIFEFTDDYSIFDYGKMPDTIPGKGAAMAMGSAYMFESIQSPKAWQDFAGSKVWNKIRSKKVREELKNSATFKMLTEKGLPTHYRGLVDPETGRTVKLANLKRLSNLLEVDAVQIIHPIKMEFAGSMIWNYNHFTPDMKNYLVPLECIFRFGVPTGSSLFKRLKLPGYMESLGLTTEPKPNDWLPRPVIEYFSKLEPADRHLSHELALNVCGLTNAGFVNLHETTLLISLFLADLFSKVQLTLWDGKFEFLMKGKKLTLGDAITPDELRLTYKGVQISKEPLRQFYTVYHPEFVKAMDEAKIRATKADKSLRDIVNNELKCPPPKLDPEFKQAVADMYTGLTAQISGTELFGDVQPLAGVLKTFKKFKIA